MNKNMWQGQLAESKIITMFIEHKFTIYLQFSDGRDKFDFIAHRDNNLYRVQVKSSRFFESGAYRFHLETCSKRYNRSRLYSTFNPDNNYYDIYAAYIIPLDRACFIPAKIIKNKRSLSIRTEASTRSNRGEWLASDYTDLEKAISIVDNF